jgi:predicted NBD/HSP70 family sugar kinase
MNSNNSPAVPSLIREINERRALDFLRNSGALHAAEIARLVGLSRPTTADILRGLVENGLVQEYLPGEEDSKRAKSVFEAISDVKVSLGIDIGSRFIRAAVGDLNGKIRSSISIAVKAKSLKAINIYIQEAVAAVLAESGYKLNDVSTICVGTPGVIQQTSGVVSIAGTIAALDGVNLSEIIMSNFGIKPTVENDINVLTVAEQIAGHGKGLSNFCVLSVGSGLGGGLVLNGQLHRGHHGAAGEVFYVPFGDPHDKHRSDTNPSGDRIAENTRNLAKKYRNSVLKEPYSTVEIINAAKEGDELGKAVVAQEAERIALYIAAISAITDVELIVLSGGIGRQADFFLSPIKKLVSEILPFPPKIAVSKLGDNGILIGTIHIATAEAREKVFQSAMIPTALDQAK